METTRLFQKNRRYYQKDPLIIGIAGISRGVGVTHLCILLANYYVGIGREKVAVLEWNLHQDFNRLAKMCTNSDPVKNPCPILDVHYYQSADAETLVQCMNLHYDRVIIDFGVINKQNQSDLVRCTISFIVGSLSEWQFNAFWMFIKEHQLIKKKWRYLLTFGNEETRKELEKKIKMPLIRIPFSEDAFTIHYHMIPWLAHLVTHD